MKTRLLSLILAQLNIFFSISHSRYYYLKKRQRLWEGILIAGSIIILALTLPSVFTSWRVFAHKPLS